MTYCTYFLSFDILLTVNFIVMKFVYPKLLDVTHIDYGFNHFANDCTDSFIQ